MATAIMKQKEVPEMDDVEEIISKISEDSPYKRRPTQKRTWMTVPEMGKLLGLKKTDRYWLVHKNVFESKEIAGKIRINIASFEKWYANQIKYHKVTGEEPGKELKSWSYSVKEVTDLLGVDEYLVYDLLKKNQMEAVIVDYWKRIPKESFQNWYKSQSRYRTILFMIYSRKIKWKLLLSITGNEYQKNLFRIGIKASPGIEQRKTEKKTLFWKMQLLRCLRWHSCLEQPEVQYIQFVLVKLFGNTLFGNHALYRNSIGVI